MKVSKYELFLFLSAKFPHHKALIILRIDNHESMVGITFGKGFSQFRLLAATPFEFVGVQKAVNVFQIINFLLLLGAPKVTFTIEKTIGVVLQALAHEIVFPKRTRILPKLQRLEVAKYRIAHTVVVEINLAAFFQFVSQVADEGTQMKNDVPT